LQEIKELVKIGADVNLADYDGRTCLHLAACENKFDIAKFLILDCKCEVNKRDRFHNSPLSDALNYNNKEIADLIFANDGKL